MPTPLYRTILRQLMQEHEAAFSAFAQAHDAYKKEGTKHQAVFNDLGAPVVEFLREGERRLCGKTERGTYSAYSSTLAEKYWKEVKAFFPLIDFVGAKISS
jgi:hypothetical protein